MRPAKCMGRISQRTQYLQTIFASKQGHQNGTDSFDNLKHKQKRGIANHFRVAKMNETFPNSIQFFFWTKISKINCFRSVATSASLSNALEWIVLDYNCREAKI